MDLTCPHCGKTLEINISPGKQRADNIYVFQWPSNLGGADTKLVHSLKLWSKFANITVVPNSVDQLKQVEWTSYLDSLAIKYCAFNDLPYQLDGYAISLSNEQYISGRKIAKDVHDRGLRTIWGNEMMFLFAGEQEFVRSGAIDILIYPSQLCLNHFSKLHPTAAKKFVVGNYIDAGDFPFSQRTNQTDSGLIVGRLSRHAPTKYPEDFPVFYESMGFNNPHFRVMAWNQILADKYSWHTFDSAKWELLPPNKETSLCFLSSLDLFLYPIGHRFIESWGRSTVEAMLTGAIPIVPTGHAFEELFDNGKHGFICSTFEEFRTTCQKLQSDPGLRRELSMAAAARARELMDPAKHKMIWREVFHA